jgi:penicillin-binding protein 1A
MTNRARKRPSKSTFTTKSGSSIKLNRNFVQRMKARKDERTRRKAAYLATLPKNRFKRVLYRLRPKELARYWFSRDGAIMALKILGIGIVVVFVLIVGIFAYFRKDLPNINSLAGGKIGGSNIYYDRTCQTSLWQDYDTAKRIVVPGDQIAQNMKDATIAIEDKDYYKHGAFDARAIVRAGLSDVFNRSGGVQGGSTISQQVVKLDQQWVAERTVTRKVKELILAVELEREYSKDEILNAYLNMAPYGPIENGVEIASNDYFGIHASELDVAKSAFLAAIPKSPNTYSPYGPNFDPEQLIGRQHYIIDQMRDQGYITKEEAEQAKAVDVLAQIKPRPEKYESIKAPYFVLAAKDELEQKFGVDVVKRGGFKICTTLDLGLQDLAEKKVNEALPIVRRKSGDSAAFVAMDNATGQIVAMVGGDTAEFNKKDSAYGQLNFGHQLFVSPGSSFKPYDYAAFIENNNAGAGSVLYDEQGAIPGYPCTNKALPKNGGNCLHDYDFRFPGAVTLRYGLAASRNIPAVKAMLLAVPNDTSPGRAASIKKTTDTAEALMGGSDKYWCFDNRPETRTDVFKASNDKAYREAQETACFGSSAIGDGAYLKLDDHVNGLASLARLGASIPRTYILKVTDTADKPLYEFKQPAPQQAVRQDTAYIINDMLSDPRASYLTASRKFQNYKGWKFAVKTGTTNDDFDGLMGSWSTKYTALAWVGHHTRNKPLNRFMEEMTTPIVRGWMEGAHSMLGGSPVNWQKPGGVQTLPAFVQRGHVGGSTQEPGPEQDIFPSWYKPPKGGGGTRTLDVVSNKLSTTCTPDLAKKTEGGGSSNTFSVDAFVGALTGTRADAEATDDIHNCNDSKPAISLTAPSSCEDQSDCIFTVTVTRGTHLLSGGSYTTPPAGTLALLVNGQAIEVIPIPADSSALFTHSFSYQPAAAGNANVEAQAVDSVLYLSSQSATVEFTP